MMGDTVGNEKLSEMALNTLTMIGNNVRFIRKSLLDVKLNPMADLTGVSRDVLCRLEALASGEGNMGKGRVYPSIQTLFKFCESIGISLDELLTKEISIDPEIQSKIVNFCGVSTSDIHGLKSLGNVPE